MILNEWQIWHTYSTFFRDRIPDLEIAAREMVSSGLVECAVSSTGVFYWCTDGNVQQGQLTVIKTQDQTKGRIVIQPQPEGFALEAVWQAANLRFSEIRQFGEDGSLMPPYVRAFMGECQLISQDRTVIVYPIVKLHATGVVLVEMRIINPDRDVALEEFIDKHVNLFKWSFEEVWGSSGLVLLANRAWLYYQRAKWPIHQRFQLLDLEKSLREYVRDACNQRTSENPDFSFDLVPLWRDSVFPGLDGPLGYGAVGHTETFASLPHLAHAIIGATGAIISELRTGIDLLLRGQKPPLALGDFWVARPHIHIARHCCQGETAQLNEQYFRQAYGSIMARVVVEDVDLGSEFLPHDARPFEDFAAYIGPQGSLWAWSKSGIRQARDGCLTHQSHLVYENQPKAELLDYGYMLHRRLASAARELRSSEQVLSFRREVAELRLRMGEAGPYGEIRALLDEGWKGMGIPVLRELITELLEVAYLEQLSFEERTARRLEVILTIAFGLLAVPTLAGQAVQPIWDWQQWSRPLDKNLAKLFFVSLATVFVAILLCLVWIIAARKDVRD